MVRVRLVPTTATGSTEPVEYPGADEALLDNGWLFVRAQGQAVALFNAAHVLMVETDGAKEQAQ